MCAFLNNFEYINSLRLFVHVNMCVYAYRQYDIIDCYIYRYFYRTIYGCNNKCPFEAALMLIHAPYMCYMALTIANHFCKSY